MLTEVHESNVVNVNKPTKMVIEIAHSTFQISVYEE